MSKTPDLKAIRTSLGLGQQFIAGALGVEVATYSKLERGKIQLTVERLYKLSKIFNLTPEEILHFGSSQVSNGKTKHADNVTFVPVAAQAGLFNGFSSEHSTDTTIPFSLPIFYERDLFLINLEGDSMYPTFCNGDYILVKQLDFTSKNIKWGEPYLIITDDGQVVKRIMKSQAKNSILLKSDNHLYEPYEVENTNIKSIWELKGVISKNLAPRTVR